MVDISENELNNIFEEKLYVSKRKPLDSITNSSKSQSVVEGFRVNRNIENEFSKTEEIKNKERLVVGKLKDVTNRINIDSSLVNIESTSNTKTDKFGNPASDLESSMLNTTGISKSQIEKIPQFSSCKISPDLLNTNVIVAEEIYKNIAPESPFSPTHSRRDTKKNLNQHDADILAIQLPKESSLEGIYDDVELKDVLNTRNKINEDYKKVSFKDSANDIYFMERNGQNQELINSNIYNIQPIISQNRTATSAQYDKNANINHNTVSESLNIIKNIDDIPHLNSTERIKKSGDDGTIDCLNQKQIVPDLDIEQNLLNSKDLEKTDLNVVFTNKNINAKEKRVKELEQEFNLMIQTQKDVLKTKSKIYQFIYSEIQAMRKEFSTKVNELEKENIHLKEEINIMQGKMQRMKDAVSNYNQSVLDKVERWKIDIKVQIAEYLKSRGARRDI